MKERNLYDDFSDLSLNPNEVKILEELREQDIEMKYREYQSDPKIAALLEKAEEERWKKIEEESLKDPKKQKEIEDFCS